jgi:hypothetical protein
MGLRVPFGPSSDSTMPDGMVRSKRSTTVRSAYFLVSCCAQMAVSVMTGPALSFPARSRPGPQRASWPEPSVVADVGQDRGQSLVEHLAADATEQPGHEHPLDAAEPGVLPG